MAYGMLIEGANGIYQIDSDSSSTTHAGIRIKGAVLAGGSITGLEESDLVFANGSAPSAGGKLYVEADYNSTYSTLTFNQATNYIVLRIASSSDWDSIVAAGDDYGLQIKNNTGAVIFDSRMVNSIGGLEITKGIPAYDLPGGTSDIEYDGAEMAPDTGYTPAMLVANTFYTGNLTNQWVCMHGCERYGMDVDDEGELKHGFVYHYNSGSTTTGVIYFRSYSQWEVIGSLFTYEHPNLSDVLLGEFKS